MRRKYDEGEPMARLSLSIPESTRVELERIALDYSLPRARFSITDVVVLLVNQEAARRRESLNEETPCFVYLMRKTQNGHLKVGVSRDPEYRKDCLKRTHYSDFEIIHECKCANWKRALICESFLQKQLRQFRIDETAITPNGKTFQRPDGYTEFFRPEALDLALRSLKLMNEFECGKEVSA